MQTFVVRIVRPAAREKRANPRELHGVVEELRSKQSHPFRGSDELLRLLGAKPTKHLSGGRSAAPDEVG